MKDKERYVLRDKENMYFMERSTICLNKCTENDIVKTLVDRHFQQYFSYIVVVSFIVPGENHRPTTSNWHIL